MCTLKSVLMCVCVGGGGAQPAPTVHHLHRLLASRMKRCALLLVTKVGYDMYSRVRLRSESSFNVVQDFCSVS